MWETVEVQEALATLTGKENPDMWHRLSVQEYNAYITSEVSDNLDAQAWARVDRKKRPGELAAEYAAKCKSDSGVEPSAFADEGTNPQGQGQENLKRVQMPFEKPSELLQATLAYVRTNVFTEGLEAIYNTQALSHNAPERVLPTDSKKHWQNQREAVTELLDSTKELRRLSENASQVHLLRSQQTDAFKERSVAMHDEEEEEYGAAQGQIDVGMQVNDDEEMPVVWVEPEPNTMLPSKYIESYIDALFKAKAAGGKNANKIKLPNLQQRRWLALVAHQLDVIVKEEHDGVPWESRTFKKYRLFSEGGCGKTWLVHTFIVPAAVYAFNSTDAIRLVAFTNAQSANLSSKDVAARTLHTSCGMSVQKLSNSLLAPGKKLKALIAYWQPVRVLVMDEITLCPAEAYNMGLLRTAFARQEQCDLNIGDYSTRGNYWGRIQLVLELGDPLQNRPVRAVSLFDTSEMLMQTAENNQEVSVEAQTGIRAFNDADLTMQLNETRRFVPGDQLPLFLQSLRRADASKGRFVDPGLWTQFEQRCASQDQHGRLQRDPRLNEERMQDAFTLHLYWAGVMRAWFARAQRDARRLQVPLYWIRASYEIAGLDSLSTDAKTTVQKQLLRTWNIHNTAHLHPVMLLHVGQRLKLTEKISAEDRLVQEAVGTVIGPVLDPAEPPVKVDNDGNVTLMYMPLGVWMHMDECVTAPLAKHLEQYVTKKGQHSAVAKEKDGHVFADHVVFVPAVTRTFRRTLNGTVWTIKMRQMPLTSGKDRTITSSQGLTLSGSATIIDMGNMNTPRDDYWLNLYVAMSRATRFSDLFIYRSPPKSFFDQGPPEYLRETLHQLDAPGGGFEVANAQADRILQKFKWPVCE